MEKELRAEIAKLEAANGSLSAAVDLHQGRADAAIEALQTIKAEQVTNLLNANANRVTPAIRPSAEKLAVATGNDFAAVKEFVDALPVSTRAEQVGDGGGDPPADEIKVTKEDTDMAAMFPAATAEEHAKARVAKESN